MAPDWVPERILTVKTRIAPQETAECDASNGQIHTTHTDHSQREGRLPDRQ